MSALDPPQDEVPAAHTLRNPLLQPVRDSAGSTRGSYWHCRHDPHSNLPLSAHDVFHVVFLLRQKQLPRELVVAVLDLASYWIWEAVPSCTKRDPTNLTSRTVEHGYGTPDWTRWPLNHVDVKGGSVKGNGEGKGDETRRDVDDTRRFARLRAFVFRLEVTSLERPLYALSSAREVRYTFSYAHRVHVVSGWIEPLAPPRRMGDGSSCQLGEVVALVDRADVDAMIRPYTRESAPASMVAPRGSGPVEMSCHLMRFSYRLGPHCLHALYALR